jgi:hypothetical protein
MSFFDEGIVENDSFEDTLLQDYQFGYENYDKIAAEYYNTMQSKYHHRFSWIGSGLFKKTLLRNLKADSERLVQIIDSVGTWRSAQDRKLNALINLVSAEKKNEKVLIFTQYADTADYLYQQMASRGVVGIAKVTGDVENVSELVVRFSPKSNGHNEIVGTVNELRILISTDVLSEGQNLQDAHIVVNYDLPWALIRLIQRAGRVDRIGQESPDIWCYSFLPEDGIEQIIRLRNRLKHSIAENAEVVGSDEVFFDGDPVNIADLYSEKKGLLDEDSDDEIDLASYAYQIWHNATKNNPVLKSRIENLSDVVFSAKPNTFAISKEGVIVYAKTPRNTDLLTWIDGFGQVITQSQTKIIHAAQCDPTTPSAQKLEMHHELVRIGVNNIMMEESRIQGSLGRKGSVKHKSFTILSRYYEDITHNGDGADDDLKRALDDIYKYPLTEYAITTLGRQLKIGIEAEQLAELVKALREEDRLCITDSSTIEQKIPRVICSLGIINGGNT